MAQVSFHWADYLVFSLMVVISLLIGVYFAVISKNQKPRDYLMGRHLSLIPVVISMVVSGVNPNGVLGFPAEVYLYGPRLFLVVFAIAVNCTMTMVLYVPMFYKLQLTSINEYFSVRFQSKGFERFITIQYLINTLLIGGAPILATARSVSSVTAIPTDVMILLICVVATFSAFTGGMRGVVWADVFQGLILIAGMCLVLIKGAIAVGGWNNIWGHYFDWDRDSFVNWSFDPTIRYTFWTVVAGDVLQNVMSQPVYMRMVSQPTLCRARWTVMLMMPLFIILLLITLMSGVAAFAYYASINCDPIASKVIPSANQILPYFVQDIMNTPGVPGAFMAALLASLLTTISSLINGWVALFVTMIDDKKLVAMSDRKKNILYRLLAVVFGMLYFASSFLAKEFPATVMQITVSMGGAYVGAVSGARFLGMTLPWIGTKCTLVAFCVGYIPFIALSVGVSLRGLSNPPLPTPTDGCVAGGNISLFGNETAFPYMYSDPGMYGNITQDLHSPETMSPLSFSSTGTIATDQPKYGWDRLFSLSYLLYDTFTFLLCYIVGFLLSLIPYFHQKFRTPDAHLLPAVVRWNWRRFVQIKHSPEGDILDEISKTPAANGVKNDGFDGTDEKNLNGLVNGDWAGEEGGVMEDEEGKGEVDNKQGEVIMQTRL